MAVSNYHKQNFSDFASPDSNNPDPLRRNFKFEDKKNSDEYQKKLEDVLSQLKKKDKQPENPFYDNSFQHNLNVPRSKQPDISLDFRNQQLPSISRLSDRAPVSVRNDRREPAQKAVSQEIVEIEKKPANGKNDGSFRGYDKRSLPNNNDKGSFFDGFGQNSRHNNIVKDYQEYMRNNPIPLKNKRLDDYDEREKDRISLRKKNEQKQAEKDWYAKEIGVGILPGMGGMTDNRRGGGVEPHRRQVTSEFKSPQEKFYDYEPTEKVRRGHSGVYDAQRGIPDMAAGRGVTRDELNRVSLDVPGSRLAGIGSRILESERLPQYMRTPQYTPNKEPMNFKFATPQIQKDNLEMGPNLAGKFKEMQGYSYDVDSYSRQASDRKERGYEDFREGSREAKEFPNEERWQNINRPERRNPRDNDNNGNNVNWLEERQKKDQDKKDRQKEELQRAYREQIEEKKRKKDEEQRRIMAEERKEEDRLRRENEELQKQFQLEMQKKREAEEEAMKANEVEEDEYTKKRLMKKRTRAVETSAENVMKKKEEVPVIAQDYPIENKLRFEDEQLRLDDFEKDFGRKLEEKLDRKQPVYEFSRDPEMEVQREITKKMNSNLDEQLEKMRRDVDYHAKMLRTELTSYKTQAMVSQDLRQNAQKELERLRDDLKHQQIYANREPVASFDPSQNKNSFNAGKGQRLDTDRSTEKMNIMLPSKSYAKMYSPENEGQNLELSSSAGGLTLDFETKYVPVKDGQESYARNYDLFKEPAKLTELMKKYGVDEEDGNKVKHKNDAAMKKFGLLFPKQANSPQKQDSFSALEAKVSGGLDLAGHGTGELGHYYPKSSARQVEKPVKSSRKHIEEAEVEGGDEIERIENLLRNYRDPDLKFRDEEKKVVKPLKDGHAVSNKRIINELEHDGFTGRDEKEIKVPVDHHKVLNNEHGGHEEEEDYELKDFEMKDEEEEIGMGDEQGHDDVVHHGGGLQDKLVVAKGEKGQINMTNNVGELEDEEH